MSALRMNVNLRLDALFRFFKSAWLPRMSGTSRPVQLRQPSYEAELEFGTNQIAALGRTGLRSDISRAPCGPSADHKGRQ